MIISLSIRDINGLNPDDEIFSEMVLDDPDEAVRTLSTKVFAKAVANASQISAANIHKKIIERFDDRDTTTTNPPEA